MLPMIQLGTHTNGIGWHRHSQGLSRSLGGISTWLSGMETILKDVKQGSMVMRDKLGPIVNAC
jgi:hypothetical protein